MKNVFKKMFSFSVLALIIGSMIAGCNGSDDNNDSAPAAAANSESKFVGSWALHNGNSSSGPITSYLHFETNKSYVMSDGPDKNHPHVTGTWSVTGDTLNGPGNNPGVGSCEVVCTVDGNSVIHVDFIEHWHSPYKHIPFSGSKV